MSECQIKRNFCMAHRCWVKVQDDPRCPMWALEAEVERLARIVAAVDWGMERRAEAAEAEIERLTAIVQRVEALRQRWSRDVIATLGKPMPGGVLSVSLDSAEYQLGRALRGESDE